MKIPFGWETHTKKTAPAPKPSPQGVLLSKKLTARIDMGTEVAGAGCCPECGKPMGVFNLNMENGDTVKVIGCKDDRIFLPAPSEKTTAET